MKKTFGLGPSGTLMGEGTPKICIPIVAETVEEIRKKAEEISLLPAEVVEWRADFYEDIFVEGKLEEILSMPVSYTHLVIIPILRKLKVGQTVRDDGPQTHLKKNGTPTMGGIIFLLAVLITSLIYAPHYPKVIPILFMTVGFGIVGFLDDFIKVVLHRSEGLTPAQKMAGQLVVTAVFAYYMVNISDVGLTMLVPFFPEISINLGWLSIPLLFFVVIGTVNGTNFTDGLDGLAASVTVMVAVFFSVVAIGTDAGIAPVTLAVAGGLMGFLLFNVYPASVLDVYKRQAVLRLIDQSLTR